MKFRAADAQVKIMRCPNKRYLTIALSAAVMLLGTFVTTLAQATQTQTQTDPGQAQNAPAQNPQANQGGELRLLGLTPDQIQKIRTINLDLKDERQAANLKLREAQRALTEAVESPTPNEDLIAQRSREVGIRLSLGADRGSVVALLLWGGLRLVLVGVAVGLAVSLVVMRLLRGLLFGVGTLDPLTFFAVPLVLVIVAGFAAYVPALRAGRVDPIRALRAAE